MRLPPAQLSPEEAAVRAMDGNPADDLQSAIANAPDVARNTMQLIRSLRDGLAPRLVELVILSQTARTGNSYCWSAHVPTALATGLSSAEIGSLRDNEVASFGDDERELLEYVGAVLDRSVSAEHFARMRRLLGDSALVKVTMLVGYYTMIGYTQSAMDVTHEAGFEDAGPR